MLSLLESTLIERFWNYYYFPETYEKPVLIKKVSEIIRNYTLEAHKNNKMAIQSIFSCLDELTTLEVINGS